MLSTTPPTRWTSWSSENRGLTAELTAGRRLVSRRGLPGWAAPWLLLVPWIIAGVVVGYTWKLVYDPQIGLANAMLVPLGFSRVAWLLERWPAIAALVVANVWAAYGVVLLVVSSALTNVPQSLILAGQVDGAGTLTIIRRIG